MEYQIKTCDAPKNWKDLKPHPLSALTTFGAGINTDDLAGHMRQHGYDDYEPILLLEKQIFDGRHRHLAAQNADVKPTFAQFSGNAVTYVHKKLLRQHLNDSQRGMLAAALIKAAKDNESANLPTCHTEYNQATAADAVNVSTRTVGDAVLVTEEGGEQLQEQVKSGEVTVSAAAEITRTVRCTRCTRLNIHKADCGACETARAKAAKAKPKRGGKRKKKEHPKGDAYEGDEKPADADKCPTCKGAGWIPKAMFNELFEAIADVTDSDRKVSGSHIAKVARLLLGADPPYTPDEVRRFPEEVKKAGWKNVRVTVGMLEKYCGWLRKEKTGGGLFDGIKEFLKQTSGRAS